MKPSEFRQLLRDNEEKRIGDIYRECQKRGCDDDFCKAFYTRILLFPLRQTEVFIDFVNEPDKHYQIKEKIKKWKIYLEVYIELRPEDKKTDERKRALKLLENMIETYRSQ